MSQTPGNVRSLKRGAKFIFGAVISAGVLVAPRTAMLQSLRLAWSSYGHDAQHTAQSDYAAQPLSNIHWQAPVDLSPQYAGNDLLIHYGSPLITAANTVIFPVKTGATSGFRVDARDGTSGAQKWSIATDYILPPHNWTPSVSTVLTPKNRLYVPGAGGTVYYLDNPDSTPSAFAGQIAFYGLTNYQANQATYNGAVVINTPITSDRYGSIYFGVQVIGSNPAGLTSSIVKIRYDGVPSFVTVKTAAGDNSMNKVVHNCAPALSNDHRTLYVAVSNGNGSNTGVGYLLAINTSTMVTSAKVRLKDPKSNNDALLSDDGTACPTVGPDGDVYYGTLENPFFSNHLRGFLLHFNSTLSTTKTPAAFGWDDSASIVPSSIVSGYTGPSTYLLCIKYNNYATAGGDGVNKVAIVDPNATMTDPIAAITVMNVVRSVTGPTPDADNISGHPNAVREWCINTAAVDLITRSIIVNNEDGKCYRWNLDTNTLSQVVTLTSGIGEAYTPTVIGPDGTAYAINNATLFALGN